MNTSAETERSAVLDAAGESHVSVSQIETFDLCPRKWAFSRVEPEGEPNRFAEYGKRTHKYLENWLRDATPPDMTTPEGMTAVSGLHLLPQCKAPGLQVEDEFRVEIAGHRFVGLIDWQMPGLLGDHKTCGGFDYCLTPETLRTNTQAVVYSLVKMWRENRDELDLRWVYYRRINPETSTKPVPARAVDGKMTRADVEAAMPRIIGIADKIRETRRLGLAPNETPYDLKGCDAYGGCPYRLKCNIQDHERAKAAMTQAMSKEQFLAGLNPPANGTPVAPPAPPPPAPPSAPALPTGAQLSPDKAHFYDPANPAAGWQPVPPPAPPAPAPPPPAPAPPPPAETQRKRGRPRKDAQASAVEQGAAPMTTADAYRAVGQAFLALADALDAEDAS